MKWKKALVTGGAGFIGSHLVDALVKNDINVRVVDNFSSGFKKNLENILNKIEIIEGDISELKIVQKAVIDVDLIFHIAANANVPKSVEDPFIDFKSNVVGTFNLLKTSLDADIKKFVYASSAAVYGEPKYFPIDEDHPKNPISPYGASKLIGEIYGFTFHKTYGLNFSALRIFNAIGPRQPRYVIYDFLNKLKKDKSKLKILGTGENIRDFIYVGDVVKTFIKCAEKSICNGNAYNVGTGTGISITDLAKQILAELHLKDSKLEYTGFSWKGDVHKLIANPSKLIEDLKIEEFIPLTEAISDEINWYIQNISKI